MQMVTLGGGENTYNGYPQTPKSHPKNQRIREGKTAAGQLRLNI